MNSKPVLALPEVAADLAAAADYYDSWRQDGREHSLHKYEETVSWIEWNPDLFPRKHREVRRAIVKRTHFIVYFLPEVEFSLVIAVLDGRQDPAAIRQRLDVRRLKPAP